MNYGDLKAEISSIVSIVNEVPDAFKERCFELLLQKVLEKDTPPPPKEEEKRPAGQDKAQPANNGDCGIPIQAQMRVFLRKYQIEAAILDSILHYENGEIHFIKEPSHHTVARGQIEWALLLALKAGVLQNKFEVDPEGLRSICQTKGYYDRKNFAATLKNNSALFRTLPVAQGDAVELSANGEQKLAELIKTLNGSAV